MRSQPQRSLTTQAIAAHHRQYRRSPGRPGSGHASHDESAASPSERRLAVARKAFNPQVGVPARGSHTVRGLLTQGLG